MDYEFIHKVCPGITLEMWKGNAPVWIGHEHVNGGFCDRWDFQYGGGETYHGEIIEFEFRLTEKAWMSIVGDVVHIFEYRYAGKTDVWEYCNKTDYRFHPLSKSSNHELEDERVIRYLNSKFPDCKAWDMVRNRAMELYGRAKEEVTD